jgi:hypothetical protein
MPDNKETRKKVADANEKLKKAKEWGIGVNATREELQKAIAEYDKK